MSTICCMLHLFGSGLGQKGSTLYLGASCACAVGVAPRTPKQKVAIATAQILVQHDLFKVYSFPSPQTSLCSVWPFSAPSGVNSEKRNTEITENRRAAEPQQKGARRANISTVNCPCRLPRFNFAS